jgi:hypothetical protein
MSNYLHEHARDVLRPAAILIQVALSDDRPAERATTSDDSQKYTKYFTETATDVRYIVPQHYYKRRGLTAGATADGLRNILIL